MMSQNVPEYFILLEDVDGTTKVRPYVFFGTRTDSVSLLRGDLLIKEHDSKQPDDRKNIALRTWNTPQRHVVCPRQMVGPLTLCQAQLLAAVAHSTDRYDCFTNGIVHQAEEFDRDTKVIVSSQQLQQSVPGVIWYCGPIEKLGNGIWFGVELLSQRPLGNCNGTFHGKEYFTCSTNRGLFVSLEKLRLCSSEEDFAKRLSVAYDNDDNVTRALRRLDDRQRDRNAKQRTHGVQTRSQTQQPNSQAQKQDASLDVVIPGRKGRLSLGMRVIVFSDKGKPHKGNVRWLGELYVPQATDDGQRKGKSRRMEVAGIEMDTKQPVVFGMSSLDIQQHMWFKPQHGGCKIYLPADSVLPESECQVSQETGPTEQRVRDEVPVGAGTAVDIPKDIMGDLSTQEFVQKQKESFRAVEQTVSNAGAQGRQQTYGGKQPKVLALHEVQQQHRQAQQQHMQAKEMTSPEVQQGHGHPGRDQQFEDSAVAREQRARLDALQHQRRQQQQQEQQQQQQQRHDQRHDQRYSERSDDRQERSWRPGEREQQSGSSHRDYPPHAGDNQLMYNRGSDGMLPRSEASGVNRGLQNYSPRPERKVSPAATISSQPASVAQKEKFGSTLEVDSLVQVKGDTIRYGVIRWIGSMDFRDNPNVAVAGVELEEPIEGGTDGAFQGKGYFHCREGYGWFVPLQRCSRDTRFGDVGSAAAGMDAMTASLMNRETQSKGQAGGFGPMHEAVVEGTVAYPLRLTRSLCGDFKGIQGHHNSCYLDSTLFSMFYATHVFDSLFNRRTAEGQAQEVYEELRHVLKHRIVNPLRKYQSVRADHVMEFRTLLEKFGDITGLTHEEKDPEEFLNTLLHQVFKEQPYLKLRSNENRNEAYLYQLFTEKDDRETLPTVQTLLEQSMLGSDVKLEEVPRVLIVQMPRFGKKYKMYDRILPSPKLRINDLTMAGGRICVVCEQWATHECKDCSFGRVIAQSRFCVSFCDTCCERVHMHSTRKMHRPKPIQRLTDSYEIEELELFAVLCIETSHYVSFVKFEDHQWVFFDSMADRQGGQDGYNIPQVTHLPELPEWLHDPERVQRTDPKDIPNPIRRLFVDAYMCMYIAPSRAMY